MRYYHRKKVGQTSLYQYHPWEITELDFQLKNNHQNEAIFALGNGYMGIRGTLEEDYTGPPGTSTPGVYINGVYASEQIYYGEWAPDLPQRSQTLLNLADWSVINLYLDGEKFSMLKGRLSGYSRTLDMRRGVLK
ncbi:MAG: glycoside hydrolase family 65 protein, partial [Halanaerobium sp.]|nr:glycoside hydrolase family 65 protein [Halanaerobium sp.]